MNRDYIIVLLYLHYMYIFFFNAPPTTEIYTLSLHDALPIFIADNLGTARNLVVAPNGDIFVSVRNGPTVQGDRKSTRLNSSHVSISYAVFCLKKKNNEKNQTT